MQVTRESASRHRQTQKMMKAHFLSSVLSRRSGELRKSRRQKAMTAGPSQSWTHDSSELPDEFSLRPETYAAVKETSISLSVRGEVKKSSGRLTSGLVEQRGNGSGRPSYTRTNSNCECLALCSYKRRSGRTISSREACRGRRWLRDINVQSSGPTFNERGGRTEQEPIVSRHVGRLEDRVLRLGSSLHLDEDFVREDLREPTLPNKPIGTGQ